MGAGGRLMNLDPARLAEALAEAREALDAAAARGGRGAGEVEVVVAGKYIAAPAAPALVVAGVRVVGENRLQDLAAKRELVGDALTFDFIGHLQRRKVRDVLRLTRLVHTLDSTRLAEEIAKRAAGPTRVLVECNVAEEPTKGGIVASEIPAFIEDLSVHSSIVVGGLMAMPPEAADPEDNRRHFAALRDLAHDLRRRYDGRHDLSDLSMGTSQDYLVAAEEGATLVRLGRALIDRAQR